MPRRSLPVNAPRLRAVNGAAKNPDMRRKARQSSSPHNKPRFWGRHPVVAALANPERVVRKAWVTHEAKNDFDFPKDVPVSFAEVADLGRLGHYMLARQDTWNRFARDSVLEVLARSTREHSTQE